MEKRTEKKRLSKSILDMKFMKKSKEKAYQEEEDEEGKAAFASEVTEAMRLGGSKFVIEPSFVPCEELIIGRLSYHGMNPEIERLLDSEKGEKNVVKKPVKPEADVDEVEMARRFTSLVGTIGNKFKTNKSRSDRIEQPPRKKTKFLKPADD